MVVDLDLLDDDGATWYAADSVSVAALLATCFTSHSLLPLARFFLSRLAPAPVEPLVVARSMVAVVMVGSIATIGTSSAALWDAMTLALGLTPLALPGASEV